MLPTGPSIERSVALSAIDSIVAAGGTEIASGLRMGLKEVLRHHSPSVISHVILLTDGRTYGDEAEVLELATLAGQEGIGLTAMGLGTDWNDELLDEMARRGTGTAHFIAEPDQAVELFHSQIQQLQHTSARDAQLKVASGPGVQLLHVHEVAPGLRRLDVEGHLLRLGTLPAAPPLRLLLEFAVDLPERDVVQLASFTLRAQLVQTSLQYETQRLALTDIGAEAGDPSPDIYQGAQRVATLRLQERTWEALERGDSPRAVLTLEHLADRFLELGAMDLAVATQREVETFQRNGNMSEAGRKIIKYGTRLLSLPAPPEDEP